MTKIHNLFISLHLRKKYNIMEEIKNDLLTIQIAEHGAELQSIKDKDGNEYLWQGDPKYWGKHSPLLFPIVCGLWKETYRTEGKTYQMHRHGFGQKVDFHLLSKNEVKATFAFSDTEETRKEYPYRFNLSVTYRLDNNKIHVIWHVENTDNKEIYFQIGGHPAFNVPDMKEGEALHGSLKFDNPNPQRLFANVEGCLAEGHHPLKMQDNLWEFHMEDFKDDALVFDECQLHEVQLLDKKKKPVVTVNFKAPAIGIWSPTDKNAPFICLEPWYGIHDWAKFEGEFKDKYLMNKLLPGASFMSEYTITIR
jgi:galactose mutarotase-like enzyme